MNTSVSNCGRRCFSVGRTSPKVVRSRHLHPTRSIHTPSASEAAVSTDAIKEQLIEQLNGLDRGIFGVQASLHSHNKVLWRDARSVAAAKKASIHALISELESVTPEAVPVDNLHLVAGDWRLLYSTITITGSKRTKLGLREFVRLGEFVQSIDTAQSLAVNKVAFSVTGLGLIKGSLTINASYQKAGPQRVDIEFQNAALVPKELQKLFEANYDLLLKIFNPQGWLDITYVDASHRVGRDDKGNIFYLERI